MKIKPYIVRKCIVKDSFEIRSLLEQRFTELELSSVDIIEDAHKLKQTSIAKANLCRYRNSGNIKGTLSQEDIIWLCDRYGIKVDLISAKMEPYNETICLKKIKKQL